MIWKHICCYYKLWVHEPTLYFVSLNLYNQLELSFNKGEVEGGFECMCVCVNGMQFITLSIIEGLVRDFMIFKIDDYLNCMAVFLVIVPLTITFRIWITCC